MVARLEEKRNGLISGFDSVGAVLWVPYIFNLQHRKDGSKIKSKSATSLTHECVNLLKVIMRRSLSSAIYISIMMTLALVAADTTTTTSAVFISSRNSSNDVNTTTSLNRKAKLKKQQAAIAGGHHHRDYAAVVNSAADAASAMNSISFINILCAQKNTADVRTYTQKSNTLSSSPSFADATATTIASRNTSNSESDTILTSWPLLDILFRKKHEEKSPEKSTENESSSNNNSSSSSSSSRKGHTAKNTEATISSPSSSLPKTISSHETVAEYTGRLWFLPRSRGTIKFKETIRVLETSVDGSTSIVECNTQYYNGDEWIDCSRVICHFSSFLEKVGGITRSDGSCNEDDDIVSMERKVKMTLDCKLLIWLPLPPAARRAVVKKIIAVFESVAVTFFDELATVV
ncbi:hypothetical protein ACHAWC_006513 [Mediolabrus comicus]